MTDSEWLDYLADHGADEAGGEQYSKLLYTLADSIQARTILEVGAGWGHSAAAFAASMSKRTPAQLISIDLQPERLLRNCREFVATSGVSWHLMDEDSQKADVEETVDLLYIDADPFQAYEDFDRFYWKVRPGGLVIIDGYYVQGGPTDAVDRLSKSHKFGVIPYCRKGITCMAVHHKPHLTDTKHTIRCNTCGLTALHFSYPEAREHAEAHTVKEKHLVSVY